MLAMDAAAGQPTPTSETFPIFGTDPFPNSFLPGDAIRHRSRGDGVIQERDVEDEDILTILFENDVAVHRYSKASLSMDNIQAMYYGLYYPFGTTQSLDSFRPGDRVRHYSRGNGTVLGKDEAEEKARAEAEARLAPVRSAREAMHTKASKLEAEQARKKASREKNAAKEYAKWGKKVVDLEARLKSAQYAFRCAGAAHLKEARKKDIDEGTKKLAKAKELVAQHERTLKKKNKKEDDSGPLKERLEAIRLAALFETHAGLEERKRKQRERQANLSINIHFDSGLTHAYFQASLQTGKIQPYICRRVHQHGGLHASADLAAAAVFTSKAHAAAEGLAVAHAEPIYEPAGVGYPVSQDGAPPVDAPPPPSSREPDEV